MNRFRWVLCGVVLSLFVAMTGCQQGPSEPLQGALPLAQETQPAVESPGSTPAASSPSTSAPAALAETKPRVEPMPPAGGAAAAPSNEPDPDEEPQPEKGAIKDPFTHRIPAPELDGGVAWINTAGPLELRQLRGKFVLLDFWTYCCINCMHILPELKKLEHKYPKQLVVIGVHSAKFDTEQDSQNITDAVLRYEIEHPVVNDARHAIWRRYGVSSWPTMLLIDPEGNAVYMRSGEVTFETLDELFKVAVPFYRQKGTLDETPLQFDLASAKAEKTPLRYPGKVLADEASKRLFIADSNHNRLVVATLEGKLLETIGSGVIGAADGDYRTASFNKPQGMFLKGETLYVADTENHLLRKVDLQAKQVKTIAGVGVQGRNAWPGLEKLDLRQFNEFKLPERWVGKPMETPINSPWDLWIHDDALYIAMAGPHQIWKMPLDETEIGPFAGNGREDIVDGPLLPREPYAEGYSSFAQPSGLSSDGTWLFVADSEGSSIRAVPFEPKGQVRTILGTAHLPDSRLFTFGDRDGENPLLQHALGVVWHEGQLYVADTYNNKIKQVDAKYGSAKTIAGTGEQGKQDAPAEFDEPAGLSYAAGKLYVADTNNHLIRTVELTGDHAVKTLVIEGLEPPVLPEPEVTSDDEAIKPIVVPQASVKPVDGNATITIELKLPETWKINPLAPMRYKVEAEGQGPIVREKLGSSVKVAPPAAKFSIPLATTGAGEDRVRVTLNYFYCQDGAEGLCKVGTAVWDIPLNVSNEAKESAVSIRYDVEP